MKIRRLIALTTATILMIVTLGRYSFNTTGLPKYSEKSLFRRIAISLKIGKINNAPQNQGGMDDPAVQKSGSAK